ncbi:hypothetical protein DSLASN_47210 [Desulfoluna limicola]|uniref:Peptidase A2 domain-containing protein n=1 Tax=Desulfoluna limicola TaxID=2810562 RepID=A0ABN6F9S4_9BACT|nr:retropepsin-like aspartic protease [Desulfoluna limicola]BCS99089.1 hypothetical protein DSLASN_47210 [Desulfoluna limicola]
MHVRHLILTAIAMGTLLFSQNSYGEFYQYRNAEGVICFTDDLSKVPDEEVEKKRVYYDQFDERPLAEGTIPVEEEMTRQERSGSINTGPENESSSTGFAFIENKILVRVTIGSRKKSSTATLLLDTGASTTVIHESLARRLGLRNWMTGQASIAGGQVIETGITTADFISLGSKRLDTPTLTVIPYSGGATRHEGLLGMDFLKHFPHTIDTKNRRILWAD